jgi:hypothetical protein
MYSLSSYSLPVLFLLWVSRFCASSLDPDQGQWDTVQCCLDAGQPASPGEVAGIPVCCVANMMTGRFGVLNAF